MNNSPLAKKILDHIRHRKMKPKAYFIFKTVLLALGIGVGALLVLYFASFALFSLRATGALDMPGFGLRGIGMSFMLVPWALLLVIGVSIFLLELLIRRCKFAYRRPIVYSIGLVLLGSILGVLVIERTHLHRNIFQQARGRDAPFAGRFYRNYGAPQMEGMNRGSVVELLEGGVSIKGINDDILKILVSGSTKFMPPELKMQIGDEIMVLGEKAGDVVEAIGIRKVEDDFRFFPRPPRPMERFR